MHGRGVQAQQVADAGRSRPSDHAQVDDASLGSVGRLAGAVTRPAGPVGHAGRAERRYRPADRAAVVGDTWNRWAARVAANARQLHNGPDADDEFGQRGITVDHEHLRGCVPRDNTHSTRRASLRQPATPSPTSAVSTASRHRARPPACAARVRHLVGNCEPGTGRAVAEPQPQPGEHCPEQGPHGDAVPGLDHRPRDDARDHDQADVDARLDAGVRPAKALAGRQPLFAGPTSVD